MPRTYTPVDDEPTVRASAYALLIAGKIRRNARLITQLLAATLLVVLLEWYILPPPPTHFLVNS
jgi:hypothetical protein